MRTDSGGRTLGYALVAAAASSWGLWPLFLRRAESFGPLRPELESAVAMSALTVLSGLMMLRDRSSQRADARAWAGVVWLGIADALNVVLFFRAFRLTTVAIAVLTHYLTPILVALGAPLVLGERVTRRTLFAVATALLGLVLLLDPLRPGAAPPGMWAGALCGAGSAFFYASNVLVTKRLAGRFSGSELVFFHGLVAVPLLALLVPLDAWREVSPAAWQWLGGGAIGPGATAGLLFVWGLRRVPAAHASALTLLEPLVAVAVGVTFFHEVPTRLAAVGGLLVFAGAGLVVTQRAPATSDPSPSA